MNYHGKKIAITGGSGFIGQALINRLHRMSETTTIDILQGDVRDSRSFGHLDHSYDYLFHFGAPSSQVLFSRQPLHSAESTLLGMVNAAEITQKFGIRLVYPSTGLLSSPNRNDYALCKEISEKMVRDHGNAIGLRIFASYGPGEGHKRDYASVPYLFIRDMVAGRSPVIFGDGEQVRDFIFIDDVVDSILHLAEECPDPVVDIGSGQPYSFNSIIQMANKIMRTNIEPKYIKKPGGYVQETGADPARLFEFYKPKVDFQEGIKRTIDHEKNRSTI